MANYAHTLIDDHSGHSIVFPPFVSQQDIDNIVENFVVLPDDVFVVAYPKAGTTWMEQIVHLLLNGGEQGDKVLSEAVPWVEGAASRYGGLDKLLLAEGRRRFHSHLPVQLMPGLADSKAKYIYVARNPKDNAVSFYFHSCSKMNYEGTWEQFIELYLTGDVGYGGFFDHVLPWWEASQQQDNVHFIKYENMKADPTAAIRAVADFISVGLDHALLAQVLEKSQFKKMAANPLANLDWVPQREGIPKHMRKGVVGDWRNHFSAEQSARMDALYSERMKSSGLDFEFG